ncbi:MAG: hybrid sensor histidine kinase/response regulator [Anaerolineales bacterium]|nr:hybrid sensor histidine kinase/response regulator [Anaerolineales bacterium]
MGLSEQIRQQLINSFKAEQSEHVQKISHGLLALEKNPPAEEQQLWLKEIFREAHSLKGAARAVGLTLIESLGHSLEELLLQAKEGRRSFSAELFDLLYQALDAVEVIMGRVEAGDSTPPANVLTLLARLEEAARGGEEAGTRGDEAAKQGMSDSEGMDEMGTERDIPDEFSPAPQPPSPPAPIAPIPANETIRVSVNKLDALMDQFSELVGAKIRAEQRLAEVRQMQTFAADWYKEWTALRSHYSRLLRYNDRRPPTHSALPAVAGQAADRRNSHNLLGRRNGATDLLRAADHQRTIDNDLWTKDISALLDFAQKNQEQLRTFNLQANAMYRQLANDTLRLSLIIDELQEEIKRVRMLPLATITATFGRMVRDLAREQNKQINLTINGGDTELDKRVLEQIKDPLIHLLRNAVDHGLETSAQRQQAGKSAEGQITLTASQQGNNIVISIRDDGDGLDIPAIRLAAVRKGLLSKAEADKLSEAEVANLIFNSGLSTSKIITDISGRGVGLDVVRQNVEALHGTLEVGFTPGQGTTFIMTLPLTLASSRGLLVRAGEQTFALPLTTVERMLHVERSAVARVEGKEAITYQGKPVALAWLEDLLELPPGTREADPLTVVIIAVAEKRLGLVVDSLAGEQEIVMKGLGKQLTKVGGLAGATVLGSGQVILVLHAADLVKLAGRTASRTPVLTKTKPAETSQHKTILVVDDSITTRTLEKNILEAAGYQVKLATDGEEALAALVSDGLPHLIVSDVNMPRLDGFALASRVKQDKRYANIPVILVTSLDSPADKARGIEVGADAYIVKSRFDQGNLLETVEQLI